MNEPTLAAAASTVAVLAVIAALAAAVRLRRHPAGVTAVTGAAAAVSLGVTFTDSAAEGRRALAWGYQPVLVLVEFLALLALLVLAVRIAPFRRAVIAAVAATVAASTLVLRLIAPASAADAVSACTLWALGAAGAIGIGAYLRTQDNRRATAVTETRRLERQRIADDLHDFVAYDLSEMLANAQAGQILAERDPRQATELFAHIESAGQRAMSAMDRLVAISREAGGTAAAEAVAAHDLTGVSDLAERFAASSPARVRLDLDPSLNHDVPREIAVTVYRAVSEGLTNVRRHAPAATEVTITVERTDGSWLMLAIRNDRPEPSSARQRGGFGLISLTERAEALGGRLTSGMEEDCWQLRLLLPLAVP